MQVKLDDCYIILPSTIPFSSVTSRLDHDVNRETEDGGITDVNNLLGYVIYEYEGIEVGRSALRLVSIPGESSGAQAILPGSALNTQPGDGSQTLETLPGDMAETDPAEKDPNKKVVAVNIWHLLGYIFLGILVILVAALLLRYYSPKQRRIRKAKQMRRIYTTDERRKQKKRRELR